MTESKKVFIFIIGQKMSNEWPMMLVKVINNNAGNKDNS